MLCHCQYRGFVVCCLSCNLQYMHYSCTFPPFAGLLPQLVGVSPEKAIKLTANDTMRDYLRNKDGSLPLWKECIAGGTVHQSTYPRRMCERVTVVCVCVCLSVCPGSSHFISGLCKKLSSFLSFARYCLAMQLVDFAKKASFKRNRQSSHHKLPFVGHIAARVTWPHPKLAHIPCI